MSSSYDFLVIGAGVAGLRAAIELNQYGSVLCLTKREVTESNTQYAQGGIAVALGPGDSPEIHLHDTLIAGAALAQSNSNGSSPQSNLSVPIVPQAPPPTREQLERQKALDSAYEATMRKVPDKKSSADPWGDLRSAKSKQ